MRLPQILVFLVHLQIVATLSESVITLTVDAVSGYVEDGAWMLVESYAAAVAVVTF